jgi:SAM-dependent methyltransferase
MDVVRPKQRRLNLGCGRNKRADCFNVDLRAAVEPDLVWDLERHPYPLPDGQFDSIHALDVVEHLVDVQGFVEEAHRLLAPGGVLEITTPHFSCANSFTDPTHRHHLGYFSFDYFTDRSGWNFYSAVRFEIAERILVFHSRLHDRLMARFANRYPEIYEQRLAWLLPAWFLIFKLRKVAPAELSQGS